MRHRSRQLARRLHRRWRPIEQSIISKPDYPSPKSYSPGRRGRQLHRQRRPTLRGDSLYSTQCKLRFSHGFGRSRQLAHRLHLRWRPILKNTLNKLGCPNPKSCSPSRRGRRFRLEHMSHFLDGILYNKLRKLLLHYGSHRNHLLVHKFHRNWKPIVQNTLDILDCPNPMFYIPSRKVQLLNLEHRKLLQYDIPYSRSNSLQLDCKWSTNHQLVHRFHLS